MSTRTYEEATKIPFTTAESDFQKLLETGDDFANKKELIDYAATDFVTLRDSLLSYMKAVYPNDYQNFSESDFGVMFTELVAYMGSVLSFKADALANENFLSTAKNRNNVRKLLGLIGIRLKGPTSAGANAQLVLNDTTSSNLTITATNRVFSLTSPMDGGTLQFTLYKTSAGKVVDMGSNTADLSLATSESTDPTTAQTWTNLALLEGALVQETGVFNSTQVFKTIQLTQGPVIENSVQVFVNDTGALGGSYTQVDNVLSASGPTDKLFDVTYDDNFNGTVRFGDGVVGSSPPNSSAYRVLYRVGGGTRGNLLGATINAPITTSEGAATVTNTSVATGGLDAETIENAKRYGPLAFKQQDRLVTLQDYQSYVSRYSSPTGGQSIGTASTRKAYSSANMVDLYVLQKANDLQLQKATVEYKVNLLESIQTKKMLTDEVNVVDGLIRTLDLVTTIFCDESFRDMEEKIKVSVATIIRNHFSYSNFGFGKSFTPQDLNRLIYDITEVRYSTVDNVKDPVVVNFNEVIQLNNLTINVTFI
mgnify:FL=1|tara:strand:+ start:162 stop:1772 length:1611 start_codon:yes stop_codon:yes gene_type:complete